MKVFGVAAKPALKGKLKDDDAAVKKETGQVSQILGEQIQNNINASLEREVDRLEAFEEYFMEATKAIQEMFFSVPDTQEGGTAVSTTLNYFTLGGGSAYLGFKQAGWKGAV